MAAAAHNPAFAKKMGIPQSVAKDFNQADAGTGILRHGRGAGKAGKFAPKSHAKRHPATRHY